MSNSIGKEFNPFQDALGETQRLRLKDGKLTIEDSTVRSSQNAWVRFWTRGEYSQKTILKNMKKIYSEAINQQKEDRCNLDKFRDNYKDLIDRASAQNDKYKNINFITRFFKAKSFIDLESHSNKLLEINKNLLPEAPNTEPHGNDNPDLSESSISENDDSSSEPDEINPDFLKSTISKTKNSSSESGVTNPSLFESTIFPKDKNTKSQKINQDLSKSTISKTKNSRSRLGLANSSLGESTIFPKDKNTKSQKINIAQKQNLDDIKQNSEHIQKLNGMKKELRQLKDELTKLKNELPELEDVLRKENNRSNFVNVIEQQKKIKDLNTKCGKLRYKIRNEKKS